jgi:hypothetical protein
MSGGAACTVNLGPREVHRRLVPGVVMLCVGGAAGIAAVALGWGLIPRLVALVPLGMGLLNLVQARGKT